MAVAQRLGAPASDIVLGKNASEMRVKQARLADYRVVYFATHGLVAGDIKDVGEPSLALTLPAQPSDLDDGLLTASEIAQLKLNADWIVLSACNTIAGEKPGAEALSGLARAFFYAGARALLVSHWAVSSDAATKLTIATFDLMQKDQSSAAQKHCVVPCWPSWPTPPIPGMPIPPSGPRSSSSAKARGELRHRIAARIDKSLLLIPVSGQLARPHDPERDQRQQHQ